MSSKTKGDYIKRAEWLLKSIGKELSEITQQDVETAMGKLKAERSKGTYNTVLFGVKKLCQYLYSEGHTGYDYSVGLFPIKLSIKPVEPLTKQQINRLWDNPRDDYDLLLLSLLFSGVRKQTLLTIMSNDIIVTEQDVTLSITEKGSKHRYIPVTKRSSEVLRLLDCTVGLDNLLPIKLSESGITYRIRTLGKRANIDGLHPHRFRHTYAHYLVDSGVPISTVSQLLGHSNINTTMIYLHSSVDYSKKKTSKIDL